MIRKFLVVGKQVLFLSSKKPEGVSSKEGNNIYELLLPIEEFWALEQLMRENEYMVSCAEDPIALNEMQNRILAKIVNFIIHEKERLALKGKLNGTAEK